MIPAPLTMHLSEDIGSWRDSLLTLLQHSLRQYNPPKCSPFWFKIRRTLVICPVRVKFDSQLFRLAFS